MIYALLVMLFVSGPAHAAAQIPESVESVVLVDLVKNSDEVVNIKNSNSAGCKNPCTVKMYLPTHLNSVTKEFEEIKKTPKGKYVEVFGTSVEETTVAEPNFKGRCGGQLTPFNEELLKENKVKLPPVKERILCSLQFGLKFGDRTWSEQLFYVKNSDTGLVVTGSFHALGTP
jgi:hypothetical protein